MAVFQKLYCLRGYQNCILHYHGKNVMEKLSIFLTSIGHWEKTFLRFSEKIGGVSELLSESPHELFWGKPSFSKNCFLDHLQTWLEKFSDFCWTFPAWLSKLLSALHTNDLMELLFLEKLSCIKTFILEWKLTNRIYI